MGASSFQCDDLPPREVPCTSKRLRHTQLMRGQSRDDELRDFLTARTAELHRTAYLLTADQHRAEHLVESAISDLRRDGLDLGQAESSTRHRMARMAAAVAIPAPPTDDTGDPVPAVAGLSPRERAVLMLRCLDGYDQSATARELGITRSKARAAEESAWQSLGFTPDDDTTHQALTDFAEQATWPDPERTLAASHRSQLPRRRSRKRYAAVAAVLALTAAAPIGSQIQHNSWLRTPAGINASHGTHLHAYTQGYMLVSVDRVPIGGSLQVKAAPGEAVAPICRHFSLKSQSTWARVGDRLNRNIEAFPCASESASHYYFQGLGEAFTFSPPASKAEGLLLGRYLRLPWDKYPVAKSNFIVEHDLTMQSVTKYVGRPTTFGRTITLHGTTGTAGAVIPLPAMAPDTNLDLTGVFSPTTTGEYKITLGGEPVVFCDAVAQRSPWCRMYDHHVAQIPIIQGGASGDGDTKPTDARTLRIDARHASGPWTLQVRYVRVPTSN